MTAHSDRDLERRFSAMRSADDHRTPPLAAVLARRPAATRRVQSHIAVGFAVAVAVAASAALAVWRSSTPNEPTAVVAFTPGEMRVPTDYLLDMVTAPRAGEIPRLGAAPWFPLPMTDFDSRRHP